MRERRAFTMYCNPVDEPAARPVADEKGLNLVVDPDCRRGTFYVTDPDMVVTSRAVEL